MSTAVSGKTKRKSATPKAVVVCASRRTDVVGNVSMLEQVLAAIDSETSIVYDHPHFAMNAGNIRTCTTSLALADIFAFSWFSKDYKNIIERWNEHPKLDAIHHHFTFTINGEVGCVLEPGLTSTLAERLGQLEWIVDRCRRLGQDPDKSIMVHVDPIVVYECPRGAPPQDNLAHIPELATAMRRLGLGRMHISFLQTCWMSVKKRLRAIDDQIHVLSLSGSECRKLLVTRMLPHTTGIQLQTCTADCVVDTIPVENETHTPSRQSLASDARDPQDVPLPPTSVIRGACVGWRDIAAVTGAAIGERIRKPPSQTVSGCTCYPLRDIGSQHAPCTHGCRYCFMNPKIYDF